MSDNNINTEAKKDAMSIEYIMERIDQIIGDTQHIHDTIDVLRNFKNNDSMHGGYGDQGKAEALAVIVRSREQTNQQMLKIFDKVLDYHLSKPESNNS